MIIDLTQSISPSLKQFPGSPNVHFIKWSKYEVEGYNLEAMFLSTHTGTHMDAPSHFVEDGDSIDKIDVNRFYTAKANLIKIEKNLNELITLDDILRSGKSISYGDSIVFSTGWEKCYHLEDYMYSNPGLSVEAAKYLVKKKINSVVIDCPSIDVGKDSSFTAHHVLLNNDVIIIENVCNLDKINQSSFILVTLPLKLVHATGSPVRALAIV
jgi:kynurenine formamidase